MSAPGSVIFSTDLPFDGGILACSPDGAWMAVGAAGFGIFGGSDKGGLAVISATSGKIEWQIEEWRVNAATFTTDGTRVLVGTEWGAGWDSDVRYRTRCLDGASGEPLWTQPDRAGFRFGLSTDGRHAAAITRDGQWLVRLTDGAALHNLGPRSRVMTAPIFSNDGRDVAAGGDTEVRITQVTNRMTVAVPLPEPIVAMTCLADGTAVALCRGGQLLSFDLSSGKRLAEAPPEAGPVQLGLFGAQFLPPDRTTRILDAATDEELHRLSHDAKISGLCFGLTESHLALGSEDGTATVVDAESGQVITVITHPRAVTLVALSPDGELLASAGNEHSVRLTAFGPSRSTEVLKLISSAPIAQLAFSPIGRTLLIRLDGSTVHAYDIDTDMEVYRLPHPAPVRHVAFSVDGTLIATACDDRIARVFEAQP